MTTNNSASIVPIPQIREEKVDFGRRLTLQLRVNSLSGKTLEPDIYFHDGEEYTLLTRIPTRRDYNEQDSYLWSVWGGQLKLTRIGAEDNPRLNIEQVKPFTEAAVSMDMLRAAIQAYIAQESKGGEDKGSTPTK